MHSQPSQRKKIIHADRDELNFPLPQKVRAAMKRASASDVSHYRGEEVLVERLSELHKIPKGQIFLEGGSERVIDRIFSSVAASQIPDGKPSALLPASGFVLYFDIAKLHKFIADAFGFIFNANSICYDLPDLFSKLAKNPSILVLIDPESPLGFSIKNRHLETILGKTPQSTLVLLDQVHDGIRTENIKDAASLLAAHPNAVIARSFSKLYGLASLRIGYAICGKEALGAINMPSNRFGFSGMLQDIAVAALDSAQEYNAIAAEVREQKARFEFAVGKLPAYQTFHTDHLSCLVKVPPECVELLNNNAKSMGIRIRHLENYSAELKCFYKVTICPHKQTTKLIELFERTHQSIAV